MGCLCGIKMTLSSCRHFWKLHIIFSETWVSFLCFRCVNALLNAKVGSLIEHVGWSTNGGNLHQIYIQIKAAIKYVNLTDEWCDCQSAVFLSIKNMQLVSYSFSVAENVSVFKIISLWHMRNNLRNQLRR